MCNVWTDTYPSASLRKSAVERPRNARARDPSFDSFDRFSEWTLCFPDTRTRAAREGPIGRSCVAEAPKTGCAFRKSAARPADDEQDPRRSSAKRRVDRTLHKGAVHLTGRSTLVAPTRLRRRHNEIDSSLDNGTQRPAARRDGRGRSVLGPSWLFFSRRKRARQHTARHGCQPACRQYGVGRNAADPARRRASQLDQLDGHGAQRGVDGGAERHLPGGLEQLDQLPRGRHPRGLELHDSRSRARRPT